MPQKYVIVELNDYKRVCDNTKVEGTKIWGTLSTKFFLNENSKPKKKNGKFFFT